MKISGKVGYGTTFEVIIAKKTAAQMAKVAKDLSFSTVSPKTQMADLFSTFIRVCEVSFSAPEPLKTLLVRALFAHLDASTSRIEDVVNEVSAACQEKEEGD